MWLTIPGISCCSEAAGVLPVTCGPVAEWRRRDDASSRILVQVQAGPPSTNPHPSLKGPSIALATRTRLAARSAERVNVNSSVQFCFVQELRKHQRFRKAGTAKASQQGIATKPVAVLGPVERDLCGERTRLGIA